MKNMRKILSLVLALMMVLSLSVTAFAAENDGTATLKIYINGTLRGTEDPDAGQTIYDYLMTPAMQTKYGATFYGFTDWYGNPAQALTSINNSQGQAVYAKAATAAEANKPNVSWSTTRPGYGLVSVVEEDGEITCYNYIYAGYDWVYSVANEDVSATYMNQYTMKAGDVVTISYELVITEWPSEDPIQEEFPYC